MRRVAEHHGDLAEPRAELLAGAQVERRAGPAPVRDMHPQRDEALGAARRVLHVLEVARAAAVRAVLAAHGVRQLQRVERADHLQLLVAHRVRLEMRRRLHRGQAQELHHVVLHHVAHRARLVVVLAPAGDADVLGDGDLHVVDVARVPQRLEQRVGEADRHQVLHRLLAEVMVDPVDLRLVEMPARAARSAPRAEARSWPSGFSTTIRLDGVATPAAASLSAMVAKSARRDRQVEGADVVGLLAELLRERRPAVRAGGVDRDVVDAAEELLDELAASAGPGRRTPRARRRPACGTRRGSSSSAPRRSPARPAGIWPTARRRNRLGMILRRARSPVAPKITRSKGWTGMTVETIASAPQAASSAARGRSAPRREQVIAAARAA